MTLHKPIDPAAYNGLLAVIAEGESHGNYNAYYGHVSNTSIRFTDMTIGQVLTWQQNYVAAGSPSSAVGKYQIIRPTLTRLVTQLNVADTARFDSAMQDKMAIALINQRGAEAFVNQQLPRDQFAENLSKEWASLPMVVGPNPHQSYYAGDGLNASRVSVHSVYGALDTLMSMR